MIGGVAVTHAMIQNMLNGIPRTWGSSLSQRETEKQSPQKGMKARNSDQPEGFFKRSGAFTPLTQERAENLGGGRRSLAAWQRGQLLRG